MNGLYTYVKSHIETYKMIVFIDTSSSTDNLIDFRWIIDEYVDLEIACTKTDFFDKSELRRAMTDVQNAELFMVDNAIISSYIIKYIVKMECIMSYFQIDTNATDPLIYDADTELEDNDEDIDDKEEYDYTDDKLFNSDYDIFSEFGNLNLVN